MRIFIDSLQLMGGILFIYSKNSFSKFYFWWINTILRELFFGLKENNDRKEMPIRNVYNRIRWRSCRGGQETDSTGNVTLFYTLKIILRFNIYSKNSFSKFYFWWINTILRELFFGFNHPIWVLVKDEDIYRFFTTNGWYSFSYRVYSSNY